jgi:hypothetical protein
MAGGEGYDGTTGGLSVGTAHWRIAKPKRKRIPIPHEMLTQVVITALGGRTRIPRGWIENPQTMQTLIPQYNTDRMVAGHITKYFIFRGSS